MNTEEVKKGLTDLNSYLDDLKLEPHIDFEKDKTIKNAINFIESQQKTIEDMKCCQNCKHGEGYNITCHNEKVNNSTLRGCKCKGGHPEDTKLWESDCR